MISPPDLSRAGGRYRGRAWAFAIAHALDKTAPAVDGIDSDLYKTKIDVIVQALAAAKNR